jgi:hypothetical protein
VIVVQLTHEAAHCIFRRQNLEDSDGRMSSDLLYGLSTIQDGNIGNPESGGRNLDSQFGPDPHTPFLSMLPEPERNSILPGSMVVFTHWPFLNFAVDVLGIWLIHRFQVDGKRHKFKRRWHFSFSGVAAAPAMG